MCDSIISAAPNGWPADGFTSYDDLELSAFDLDLGFQESIPDMFQDTVPTLPVDFPPYPTSHDSVDLMSFPPITGPDLCDISNSQAYSRSPFQDSGISSVPSSTSSPVQFDSWTLEPSAVSGMHQTYEQPQFYGTTFVNGRKRKACNEPCSMNTMPADVMAHCVDFPTFPPNEFNAVGKPKRRRVQNARQRKAANVRERKRMFSLNEAFDSLKTKVPTFAYEKRLSRIETLRLAMTYISFMSDLLDGKKPSNISMKHEGMNQDASSFTLEDLENLKQTIASSYTSDGTESSECGSSSS